MAELLEDLDYNNAFRARTSCGLLRLVELPEWCLAGGGRSIAMWAAVYWKRWGLDQKGDLVTQTLEGSRPQTAGQFLLASPQGAMDARHLSGQSEREHARSLIGALGSGTSDRLISAVKCRMAPGYE